MRRRKLFTLAAGASAVYPGRGSGSQMRALKIALSVALIVGGEAGMIYVTWGSVAAGSWLVAAFGVVMQIAVIAVAVIAVRNRRPSGGP